MIDKLRHAHPVAMLRQLVNVAKSGCQMWRRGKFIPLRRLADAHLLATFKAAHQPGRSTYGPKKFQAAAQTQWHPVNAQKAIPRHDGFKASVPVAENLLNRQFTPTFPNRVRVGGRHHLYSNEWGLAVSGREQGFVYVRNRWLGDGQADDQAVGGRCALHAA